MYVCKCVNTVCFSYSRRLLQILSLIFLGSPTTLEGQTLLSRTAEQTTIKSSLYQRWDVLWHKNCFRCFDHPSPTFWRSQKCEIWRQIFAFSRLFETEQNILTIFEA